MEVAKDGMVKKVGGMTLSQGGVLYLFRIIPKT